MPIFAAAKAIELYSVFVFQTTGSMLPFSAHAEWSSSPSEFHWRGVAERGILLPEVVERLDVVEQMILRCHS